MFRPLIFSTGSILRNGFIARTGMPALLNLKRSYVSRIDDDNLDELICKYEIFFNRPDIDSWEIRKAMEDLHGMDLIPDPRIIIAGLKACRRLNDYALSIRFLEAIRFKCADDIKTIWPYILQEIRPTLTELGIETPEELGFDKPELWKQNVYEIH